MKYITSEKRLWTVISVLMGLPVCGLVVLILLNVYSLAPRFLIGYLAMADQGLLFVCVIAAILVVLGYYRPYHKPPY